MDQSFLDLFPFVLHNFDIWNLFKKLWTAEKSTPWKDLLKKIQLYDKI